MCIKYHGLNLEAAEGKYFTCSIRIITSNFAPARPAQSIGALAKLYRISKCWNGLGVPRQPPPPRPGSGQETKSVDTDHVDFRDAKGQSLKCGSFLSCPAHLMQSIGNRKVWNEGHSYSSSTNLKLKNEGLITKMRVWPSRWGSLGMSGTCLVRHVNSQHLSKENKRLTEELAKCEVNWEEL